MTVELTEGTPLDMLAAGRAAPVAPPPPAPSSSEPEPPTIASLRREHVDLLQAWSTLADEPRLTRANAFRRKVAAAGAFLEDGPCRDAGQAMIDYWTATLAGLPSQTEFPELLELAPFDETTRRDLRATATSPFVGLNAFGMDDKDLFFGRAEPSENLFNRILEQPIVIVSGPSGSGKSSLVFAGLEPRLAATQTWDILPSLTPGNDPIAALLQPFRPGVATLDWIDEQREALRRHPAVLDGLAASLSPRPVALLIDQSEEIFTFGTDAETRECFFAAIAALANAGRNHRVVMTVRSDYAGELVEAPGLLAAGEADAATFTIDPLTSRELHDAIVGPAQRIGLKIDAAVVEDLVREVVGEPAALPLLQFTLTRLWNHAKGDRITMADYQAVGQPADALRRAAEEVWDKLSLDENREAARLIFLELVRPSRGSESVRGGRVRREALRQLAASDRIDRVLAAFVAAGLIRRTPGTDIDDDRFEVAHETLIRQWPRFVGWLEQWRRENQKIDSLIATADLWRQSGDKGYLLTGRALREASLEVAAKPELKDYIRSSREWRLQRLWRAWVIALCAIGALALLGAAYFYQRKDTFNERARADDAAGLAAQEAGRVVDADIVGVSSSARAQIAEQTLARLIERDPELLSWVPEPLRPRVAAEPLAVSGDWLAAARGYDPGFLGVEVPAPRSAAPVRMLNYVNFSVAYDPARRAPRYVISNFDRTGVLINSLALTGFAPDPRLSPDDQPAAFAGLDRNDGRVSLVDWREIGWQTTAGRLTPRNDIMPVTTVQPWRFNQGRWSTLQRTLLGISSDRIVFVTGPVLDEPVAGEAAPPPHAFWKVAIYRDAPNKSGIHADAYLVPVADPGTPAPSVRSYRIALSDLSRLVGIDFHIPRGTTPADDPNANPAVQQVGGPTQVYLQFAQMSRGDARRISDALEALGYHVPGEERVQVLDLHEVRFYYQQDGDTAAKLADAVQNVLSAQGYGAVKITPRLLHLKAGTRLPKPGVLELWVTIPAPVATKAAS